MNQLLLLIVIVTVASELSNHKIIIFEYQPRSFTSSGVNCKTENICRNLRGVQLCIKQRICTL